MRPSRIPNPAFRRIPNLRMGPSQSRIPNPESEDGAFHPQIRDSGFGTRKAPSLDSGFRIRDVGFGIRGWEGPMIEFGIRDSGGTGKAPSSDTGFGIQDSGFWTGKAPCSDLGFGIRDSRANHVLHQLVRITSPANPGEILLCIASYLVSLHPEKKQGKTRYLTRTNPVFFVGFQC